MRWSPFVTVAAVIRRGDRYLMVEQRPDGRAVVNQPAGHLEFNETLQQAIRREVLEETGHPFTPDGLVGVYQWTLPETSRSYLRFCFSGSVGDPSPGYRIDSDISAVHWLTREQIAAGALPVRSPMVLRCIDDAAVSRPVPLELLHAIG